MGAITWYGPKLRPGSIDMHGYCTRDFEFGRPLRARFIPLDAAKKLSEIFCIGQNGASIDTRLSTEEPVIPSGVYRRQVIKAFVE